MKKRYPADRVRSQVTYASLRPMEREKLDELAALTGKSRSSLVRMAFLKYVDGALAKARKEAKAAA